MSIAGGKPNDRRIATHLIVKGVDRAIDFYRRAFGADVLYRSQASTDGRALHAQLRIFDSIVLLSEENMGMPEEAMARYETGMRTRSPESLKATTAILEIYVDDVDSAFRRAVDAGAIPKLPVALAFYGDRYGQVVDPFGFWFFSRFSIYYLTIVDK